MQFCWTLAKLCLNNWPFMFRIIMNKNVHWLFCLYIDLFACQADSSKDILTVSKVGIY